VAAAPLDISPPEPPTGCADAAAPGSRLRRSTLGTSAPASTLPTVPDEVFAKRAICRWLISDIRPARRTSGDGQEQVLELNMLPGVENVAPAPSQGRQRPNGPRDKAERHDK